MMEHDTDKHDLSARKSNLARQQEEHDAPLWAHEAVNGTFFPCLRLKTDRALGALRFFPATISPSSDGRFIACSYGGGQCVLLLDPLTLLKPHCQFRLPFAYLMESAAPVAMLLPEDQSVAASGEVFPDAERTQQQTQSYHKRFQSQQQRQQQLEGPKSFPEKLSKTGSASWNPSSDNDIGKVCAAGGALTAAVAARRAALRAEDAVYRMLTVTSDTAEARRFVSVSWTPPLLLDSNNSSTDGEGGACFLATTTREGSVCLWDPPKVKRPIPQRPRLLLNLLQLWKEQLRRLKQQLSSNTLSTPMCCTWWYAENHASMPFRTAAKKAQRCHLHQRREQQVKQQQQQQIDRNCSLSAPVCNIASSMESSRESSSSSDTTKFTHRRCSISSAKERIRCSGSRCCTTRGGDDRRGSVSQRHALFSQSPSHKPRFTGASACLGQLEEEDSLSCWHDPLVAFTPNAAVAPLLCFSAAATERGRQDLRPRQQQHLAQGSEQQPQQKQRAEQSNSQATKKKPEWVTLSAPQHNNNESDSDGNSPDKNLKDSSGSCAGSFLQRKPPTCETEYAKTGPNATKPASATTQTAGEKRDGARMSPSFQSVLVGCVCAVGNSSGVFLFFLSNKRVTFAAGQSPTHHQLPQHAHHKEETLRVPPEASSALLHQQQQGRQQPEQHSSSKRLQQHEMRAVRRKSCSEQDTTEEARHVQEQRLQRRQKQHRKSPFTGSSRQLRQIRCMRERYCTTSSSTSGTEQNVHRTRHRSGASKERVARIEGRGRTTRRKSENLKKSGSGSAEAVDCSQVNSSCTLDGEKSSEESVSLDDSNVVPEEEWSSEAESVFNSVEEECSSEAENLSTAKKRKKDVRKKWAAPAVTARKTLKGQLAGDTRQRTKNVNWALHSVSTGKSKGFDSSAATHASQHVKGEYLVLPEKQRAQQLALQQLYMRQSQAVAFDENEASPTEKGVHTTTPTEKGHTEAVGKLHAQLLQVVLVPDYRDKYVEDAAEHCERRGGAKSAQSVHRKKAANDVDVGARRLASQQTFPWLPFSARSTVSDLALTPLFVTVRRGHSRTSDWSSRNSNTISSKSRTKPSTILRYSFQLLVGSCSGALFAFRCHFDLRVNVRHATNPPLGNNFAGFHLLKCTVVSPQLLLPSVGFPVAHLHIKPLLLLQDAEKERKGACSVFTSDSGTVPEEDVGASATVHNANGLDSLRCDRESGIFSTTSSRINAEPQDDIIRCKDTSWCCCDIETSKSNSESGCDNPFPRGNVNSNSSSNRKDASSIVATEVCETEILTQSRGHVQKRNTFQKEVEKCRSTYESSEILWCVCACGALLRALLFTGDAWSPVKVLSLADTSHAALELHKQRSKLKETRRIKQKHLQREVLKSSRNDVLTEAECVAAAESVDEAVGTYVSLILLNCVPLDLLEALSLTEEFSTNDASEACPDFFAKLPSFAEYSNRALHHLNATAPAGPAQTKAEHSSNGKELQATLLAFKCSGDCICFILESHRISRTSTKDALHSDNIASRRERLRRLSHTSQQKVQENDLETEIVFVLRRIPYSFKPLTQSGKSSSLNLSTTKERVLRTPNAQDSKQSMNHFNDSHMVVGEDQLCQRESVLTNTFSKDCQGNFSIGGNAAGQCENDMKQQPREQLEVQQLNCFSPRVLHFQQFNRAFTSSGINSFANESAVLAVTESAGTCFFFALIQQQQGYVQILVSRTMAAPAELVLLNLRWEAAQLKAAANFMYSQLLLLLPATSLTGMTSMLEQNTQLQFDKSAASEAGPIQHGFSDEGGSAVDSLQNFSKPQRGESRPEAATAVLKGFALLKSIPFKSIGELLFQLQTPSTVRVREQPNYVRSFLLPFRKLYACSSNIFFHIPFRSTKSILERGCGRSNTCTETAVTRGNRIYTEEVSEGLTVDAQTERYQHDMNAEICTDAPDSALTARIAAAARNTQHVVCTEGEEFPCVESVVHNSVRQQQQQKQQQDQHTQFIEGKQILRAVLQRPHYLNCVCLEKAAAQHRGVDCCERPEKRHGHAEEPRHTFFPGSSSSEYNEAHLERHDRSNESRQSLYNSASENKLQLPFLKPPHLKIEAHFLLGLLLLSLDAAAGTRSIQQQCRASLVSPQRLLKHVQQLVSVYDNLLEIPIWKKNKRNSDTVDAAKHIDVNCLVDHSVRTELAACRRLLLLQHIFALSALVSATNSSATQQPLRLQSTRLPRFSPSITNNAVEASAGNQGLEASAEDAEEVEMQLEKRLWEETLLLSRKNHQIFCDHISTNRPSTAGQHDAEAVLNKVSEAVSLNGLSISNSLDAHVGSTTLRKRDYKRSCVHICVVCRRCWPRAAAQYRKGGAQAWQTKVETINTDLVAAAAKFQKQEALNEAYERGFSAANESFKLCNRFQAYGNPQLPCDKNTKQITHIDFVTQLNSDRHNMLSFEIAAVHSNGLVPCCPICRGDLRQIR